MPGSARTSSHLLRETVRRLTDDELRTTVARWLGRMDEHNNLNLPGLEDWLAMQDVTELTSRLDETVEEWRRDAVTEGQRVVLARQARLRFGAETAERIDALLAETHDWDRLASVAESIIDANSGADFLDRVATLMRPSE